MKNLLLSMIAATLLTPTVASAQDTLVVAGGCFWCVESDFESVEGVGDVVSGYTGGTTVNPTYKTLKGSGHFEAVKIPYDPSQVSYRSLLDMFFRSIDVTDTGGQFCDRGPAYRTAVFVSNKAEQDIAVAARADAQAALGQKIVTPILQSATFYEAEGYHQDYYKGSKRVVTRRGIKKQSDAYKFYRNACGRDQRVEQLWGSDAPFIGH